MNLAANSSGISLDIAEITGEGRIHPPHTESKKAHTSRANRFHLWNTDFIKFEHLLNLNKGQGVQKYINCASVLQPICGEKTSK